MTEKKKSKPNKLKKRTSQKSVFSKIMGDKKKKAPATPTNPWAQAAVSNVGVRTAGTLPMTSRTQPQVIAPTILLPALDTDSSEDSSGDSSGDSSQGGPTVTTTLSTGVGGPPPPITISSPPPPPTTTVTTTGVGGPPPPITVNSPPPPPTTTKVKQPGGYRPATTKKKPVNMQGILTLRNFADDYGSQTRVFTKVADKHKDKVQLTVEALLRDNNNYMTESQLVAKINALGDLVDQLAVSPVLPGGVSADDARVALDMRQMKDVLNDLDQLLVKVVNPTTAPFPQLRELADFLIARPGFEDALRQRGIGIIFNSNGAKGQGGGQFLSGNIHLLGGENETPVAFVRLVVHESGHATYQRMILPAHMPVLPNFWDNGTGGELRARLATLQAAADQAGVPLDQSPFATEAATIQATLTAENDAGVWGALSADAKKLYGAWLTLRANNGQDLLGLNLGAGKSPAERQKYQADNFKEFLAETFMQAMTGTIKAHYDGIQTDPNKSDAVKAAWRDTAEVLDKVAAGQILRVPTVF